MTRSADVGNWVSHINGHFEHPFSPGAELPHQPVEPHTIYVEPVTESTNFQVDLVQTKSDDGVVHTERVYTFPQPVVREERIRRPVIEHSLFDSDSSPKGSGSHSFAAATA